MTRNVVYSLSMSLDGFMQAPDGDISWTDPDDELMAFHNEQTRDYDTSLYGRKLYQNMAAYWPGVVDDPAAAPRDVEFARHWLALPKVVFSTTLESVEWNSTLVRGDLPAEVARLKALPGRNLDVGGAGLGASLIKLGLVDEYRIFVHPIVLGAGTPFFPPDQRYRVRLAETRTFGSGVLYLRYLSGTSEKTAAA